MTTITSLNPAPALDSSNQTVYLTEAGYETLRQITSTQPAWQWDLIAVNYTGPEDCMVRGQATVIDSFEDLGECCAASIELNRRDAGKGVYYTVCRHVPAPEPETSRV